MKTVFKPILIGALIASPLALHAGDSTDAAVIIPSAPVAAEDSWQYSVTPYAWLAGISGDIGYNGFSPQNIDVPIDTILDNLDLSAYFSFEANKGDWGYFVDFQYLKMSGDTSTPLGQGTLDLSLEQFKLETGVQYRVYHTEQTTVHLYGAVQYTYMDTNFKRSGGMLPNIKAGQSQDWFDPAIGVKMIHHFSSQWYIKALGEVGGFGISSDLTWQLAGGIGYDINDCWSLTAGYRHQAVDYENDGFVFDAETSGPQLGATYKF